MNRSVDYSGVIGQNDGGNDPTGPLIMNTPTGAVPSGTRMAGAQTHHEELGSGHEKQEMPSRILVVEDNIDHAHSLAELLEVWGHEVAVAYDGLSGIKRAGEFRPQIIIMDIGLPVLDGYQAARHLRANPLTRDIRLIALSGYGMAEDRRRAFEAGFDHHLTKPADLEFLRQVLSSACMEVDVK